MVLTAELLAGLRRQHGAAPSAAVPRNSAAAPWKLHPGGYSGAASPLAIATERTSIAVTTPFPTCSIAVFQDLLLLLTERRYHCPLIVSEAHVV